MKLTREQALNFRERYENRFDNEIITEPGTFAGLTVKVAEQVLVNLGQHRYVDWLIQRFEPYDKQETKQAYDEQLNDPAYVLLLVKNYFGLEGWYIKEQYEHKDQPEVSTLTALRKHQEMYDYIR